MEHRAYVLIETAVGRSSELGMALRQCDWIESVERLLGPYDFVSIARGPSLFEICERVKELTNRVSGTIRFVVAPISGPVAPINPDERDPMRGQPSPRSPVRSGLSRGRKAARKRSNAWSLSWAREPNAHAACLRCRDSARVEDR